MRKPKILPNLCIVVTGDDRVTLLIHLVPPKGVTTSEPSWRGLIIISYIIYNIPEYILYYIYIRYMDNNKFVYISYHAPMCVCVYYTIGLTLNMFQ